MYPLVSIATTNMTEHKRHTGLLVWHSSW